MKTTIALLLAASLAGCISPPEPKPYPDFLTMCNGDEGCALRMTYQEDIRRDEAEKDRRDRNRQAAARMLKSLSDSSGRMGSYKGYQGYNSRSITQCQTIGTYTRCHTQ